VTPLPPNSTKRYFLDYAVSGVQHTILQRVDGAVDDASASTAFDSIFDLVGDSFFASEVLGMRVAASGSNITVPATYSGSNTTWGSGAAGDGGTPAFASMVGRGTDGKKGRWTLFGYKQIGSVGDYRFGVTGVSGWEDLYDTLQTFTGNFITIGGSDPVWHPYVNIGWNAYWQRNVR